MVGGSTGRRRGGAQRMPASTRRSAAVLVALLIGGCGPADVPQSQPAEPADPPAVAPRPMPVPRPLPDAPVGPPLPPQTDERTAGATFEYEEPPRADDAGAHPFTATATTRDERLACISREVTITAVDAGPEPSDRRIAATLLAEVELLRSAWESTYRSEADCLLPDGTTLPRHGTLRQHLDEQPCELPGGPPLRCFTLEQDSFGGGANVDAKVDQFIFGAADGERLGIAEVLALVGVDHQDAARRIHLITCLLDQPDRPCSDRADLRRGRPTDAGLIVEFGKWEGGGNYLSPRTLFVPWELLGLQRV